MIYLISKSPLDAVFSDIHSGTSSSNKLICSSTSPANAKNRTQLTQVSWGNCLLHLISQKLTFVMQFILICQDLGHKLFLCYDRTIK